MIKVFCDVCEKELTEKNSLPQGRTVEGNIKYESGQTVHFSIKVGLNGAWDKGDICKACVLKAIQQNFEEHGKEYNNAS